MKTFQTEGVCLPEKHYMADVTGKAEEICRMVERGEYLVISRPGQYGKTGMLRKLREALQSRCWVISLSFGEIGEECFADDRVFVSRFRTITAGYMRQMKFPWRLIFAWNGPILFFWR